MATKTRGWGEGGVFKRWDGRWYATVSLGTDADGKRLRKQVSGATKVEVLQKLRTLQDEAASTDDTTITVSEWLDRWLASAKSRVRPSTYSLYATLVRTHIKPAIGYLLLAKLTPSTVQKFYATLESEGVSARTRHAVHSRLFTALKSAVRLGVLTRNVAEMVDAPRYLAPEVVPLSVVEVRTLLAAARSERLYALFLLAVHTGARQGELFALHVRDLDLKAGTLSINGTMNEDGTISPPKTARGRRRIDLAPDVVKALEEHLKRNPTNDDLLFTSADGSALRKSNFIRREWASLLKKAGLPPTKFHTLRHTAATLMLSSSVHPKVVQETLGHSSIEMTMDVYSSVIPGMGKAAASVLSDLIAGKPKPKRTARERREPTKTASREARR
jgi:integrase